MIDRFKNNKLQIITNLDLRPGDVITIHSRLGIHRYEISDIEDLKPDYKITLETFKYLNGRGN